jgi:hypothetical protein
MIPSEQLPWTLAPLDFLHDNLVLEISIGEQDAIDALAKYPNGNASEFFTQNSDTSSY